MKTIHEYIDDIEAAVAAIRQILGGQPGQISQPSPAATHERGDRPSRNNPIKAEVRDRNKTAEIVGLLKRPDGASKEEIAAITDWQLDTIRGFISNRKRAGVKISSAKVGKTTRYKIVA